MAAEIPEEMLEAIGAEDGKVSFRVEDGRVVVEPVESTETKKQDRTSEEILATIRDFAPASEVQDTDRSESEEHPMAQRHVENLRKHAPDPDNGEDER